MYLAQNADSFDHNLLIGALVCRLCMVTAKGQSVITWGQYRKGLLLPNGQRRSPESATKINVKDRHR